MSPYRTADGRRCPTLLANAETFAHLALARHGAGWFRAVGTDVEPGTVLTSAEVREPGVVEVLGTPMAELLARVGGTTGAGLVPRRWVRRQLAAVRSGRGPGGEPRVDDAHGADLGVALVVALPADRCPVAETARLLGWLASESTGQCGPCVNGLPALASGFGDLVSGQAGAEGLDRLHRWAGMVAGRGACHHPDGAVRLARTALHCFADDVRRHATSGPCPGADGPRVLPVPEVT